MMGMHFGDSKVLSVEIQPYLWMMNFEYFPFSSLITTNDMINVIFWGHVVGLFVPIIVFTLVR